VPPWVPTLAQAVRDKGVRDSARDSARYIVRDSARDSSREAEEQRRAGELQAQSSRGRVARKEVGSASEARITPR
jgi:hypothetical protein